VKSIQNSWDIKYLTQEIYYILNLKHYYSSEVQLNAQNCICTEYIKHYFFLRKILIIIYTCWFFRFFLYLPFSSFSMHDILWIYAIYFAVQSTSAVTKIKKLSTTQKFEIFCCFKFTIYPYYSQPMLLWQGMKLRTSQGILHPDYVQRLVWWIVKWNIIKSGVNLVTNATYFQKCNAQWSFQGSRCLMIL
jgi:hypothetical protein